MAHKRKWFLEIIVLLALLVAGFAVWGETPSGPVPEALAALNTDDQVRVSSEEWLVFMPASASPRTGFIFYPGGRVDYRSYAPQAHAIAAQGYLVVIPRMPLNLAVFDAGAAADVIAAYPEIQRWVVGGHSLGGSMAANFAAKHPGQVQGLVLWASYPAGSDDLSARDLAVTSIYGSNDGVADLDTVRAASALLPTDTTWVEISGGNHAQFGWYGPQGGDQPATIDPLAQQEQTVRATLALLERVENRP
jgi:pimeloyl-ACP methyl ester carboxylesterase